MKEIQRRIRAEYNYQRSAHKFVLFEKIRFKAEELSMLMAELCPYGPELENALARVREASMWAHAGIAIEPVDPRFPSGVEKEYDHPQTPGE